MSRVTFGVRRSWRCEVEIKVDKVEGKAPKEVNIEVVSHSDFQIQVDAGDQAEDEQSLSTADS